MENIFECPICLENIKDAVIGSCTHHFCHYCLFKHCKKNIKCPICRTIIREIRPDYQFQNLINNNTKIDTNNLIYYTEKQFINSIRNSNEIILDNEEHNFKIAGITLKNNKGPGVTITKLKKTSLFDYYLKVNDILLFINGVPCVNHKDVINQINYLFLSNIKIKIIKLF